MLKGNPLPKAESVARMGVGEILASSQSLIPAFVARWDGCKALEMVLCEI